MDSLLARMAESADIDRRINAAAMALQSAAADSARRAEPAAHATRSRGSTPPRVTMDLGDSDTPPRGPRDASGTEMVPPVSPQVRAVAAQSAARRASANASMAGAVGSRIPLPPRVSTGGGAIAGRRSSAAPAPLGSPAGDDAFSSAGAGSSSTGGGVAAAVAVEGTPSSAEVLSAAVGAGADTASSVVAAGDVIDPHLPRDVQLNLLRSQVRVTQRELQDANRLVGELQKELSNARQQAGNVTDERTKLQRAVAAAESALTKAKRAATASEGREAELRAQLAALQKDIAASSKAAKSHESASSSLDVRLSRALEENERLKAELSNQRATFAEQEKNYKGTVATLQANVKRLERQKEELLSGFKKQLKLIDVLKRQRIHMEAARMLAFTEEEFAKLLESAPS
jgi:predicted  nucleic acid-binding Zn-ribbon protein